MNPTLERILSILIVVLIPIVLILASFRIIFNPWAAEFEYRAPWFPEDPYGFTTEQRIRYGKIAMDYMFNDQGINFLADLRFPDGQQAPPPTCISMDDCTQLYNDRELGHMVDVKNAVRASMSVLYVGLAVILVLGVWAWQGGWLEPYKQALARGGLLTVALILFILVLVFLAWGIFFTAFHNVFFDPGTWTFPTSDTLIRLFPERLWQDVFISIGSLSAILGLILFVVFRKR